MGGARGGIRVSGYKAVEVPKGVTLRCQVNAELCAPAHLLHRGLHVASVGGGHGLQGDAVLAAQLDIANLRSAASRQQDSQRFREGGLQHLHTIEKFQR